MSFSLGDTVEWTSQSMGRAKTKQGHVVVVVPAGEFVTDALVRADLQNHRRTFDGVSCLRPEPSYVVYVKAEKALYWPRANLLKKIEKGPPEYDAPNKTERHYTEFDDDPVDEKNGDRLSERIGDTFLDFNTDPPLKQWIRISKALRVHGLKVVRA